MTRLVAILEPHVFERDLGEVYASGLKVVLDEPTGVGPDLVFISRGGWPPWPKMAATATPTSSWRSSLQAAVFEPEVFPGLRIDLALVWP